MKKSHSENTVGPWARQKLDALESYLAAYHVVMKKQRFKLIYIDAFAGAGWSKVRGGVPDDEELDLLLDEELAQDEDQFIAGSPVRALSTGRGFDRYFFLDADPRRAKLLEELKAEFPDKEIDVQVGDANAEVQRLARRFDKHRYARGVAFLDPYGPNLHWDTVKALAATGKVDVIINFPLAMGINRLIKKNGEVPENWVQILDDCFGTHEWYDLAYQESTDLFGDGGLRKNEATAERLLGLYHRRLKEAFGHVATPSLVTNTRGAPIYYLLWAASNGRGAKIADHILKLGKRVKPPRR